MVKSIIKLAAIILAAGAGKRIGQPKWQLVYNGKTFLTIITEKLIAAQISSIGCVVRETSLPAPKQYPNLKFIVNTTPDIGMFSSIFYGIEALPGYDGYVIFPVDHPFVTIATLQKLQQTFATNNECVVKPVLENQNVILDLRKLKSAPTDPAYLKSGHPIVIPRNLAETIKFADYAGGLQQLIFDQQIKIITIPVRDNGILQNINTLRCMIKGNTSSDQ